MITDHIRQPGPSTTDPPPLGRLTTLTPSAAQAARSTSTSTRQEDPSTTAGSVAIQVRTQVVAASPSWASSSRASSRARFSSTVGNSMSSQTAGAGEEAANGSGS